MRMFGKIKNGVSSIYGKLHDFDRDATLKHFPLKLIWLITFVVAITLAIYYNIKTIIQYQKYQVTTEIREIYQEVLDFPVITICNVNPMGTYEANEFIRKYYADKYNVNVSTSDELIHLWNNEQIGNVREDMAYIFYKTYDPAYQDLVGHFGLNTIVSCYMNEEKCEKMEYLFEFTYDSTYGNCQRFNTKNPPLKVDSKNDYLRLVVFLGDSNDPKNLYNSWSSGLVVSINDQQSYPITLKKGIAVKPGSSAEMDIKRTEVYRDPYSGCINKESIETNLSLEMKKLNLDYSRSNCLMLCDQKLNIEELGCYDMRLPKIFDAEPCNDETTFKRLRSIEQKEDARSSSLSNCDALCPQECETVSLDVSVSYFDFPTYYMYKLILANHEPMLRKYFKTDSGNITHEMLSKSLAAINIHFNEIKITQMNESEAMSFAELVSNVGGTIGLFIEFNILASVAFFEVLLQMFVRIFKPSWKSEKKKQHDQEIAEQQHLDDAL